MAASRPASTASADRARERERARETARAAQQRTEITAEQLRACRQTVTSTSARFGHTTGFQPANCGLFTSLFLASRAALLAARFAAFFEMCGMAADISPRHNTNSSRCTAQLRHHGDSSHFFHHTDGTLTPAAPTRTADVAQRPPCRALPPATHGGAASGPAWR